MRWSLKRFRGAADALHVIELHRIHGNGTLHVNPDLIETIEARPDTTITMVNKHRYLVEDGVEQVIERIVTYRARVAAAVGGTEDRSIGARSFAVIDDQDQEQVA